MEVSIMRRPSVALASPVAPSLDTALTAIPPLAAPQAVSLPAAEKPDTVLPFFDPTIVDAFGRSPKDKAMLIRADTEMELFMRDASVNRLPILPPAFAPNNSFQRLLIHRLADSYGLLRVMEPISSPPGGTLNHLVLQKTPQSQIPALRLYDLERRLSAMSARVPEPVPVIQHASPDSLPPQTPKAEVEEQFQPSESPSEATEMLRADALPPANFRIMTRQPGSESGRPRSSQSAEESGQLRKPMTLEEREAAYAEARQRIFASSSDGEESGPRKLPTEALTSASCPETPLLRPKALRPSAPAFDPSIFSPVASTSQLPARDDDQVSTTSSAPLDSLTDNSPNSSLRHHRSGSRSPSSASVSTIASSKTSTSTSSDSKSKTSRSASSRRISAQQPVLRFGLGTAAPPLFPPHHPQRPASPSPSAASVSTNSSRRSAGGRSIRLGPGLPDLEPMAGRANRRHKMRTRTPSPPPQKLVHPSLPEKPEWVDHSKRVAAAQQQQQQPPQQQEPPQPPTTVVPPAAVQPMPAFYQPGFFAAAAYAPTPHAYYAPALVPTGYYAVPVDAGQPTPMWDPFTMAALLQQQQLQQQQQHMESMMGQLHLSPANGDVPIQLDEDSPRAARAPSMALFDPSAETSLMKRTTSNGRRHV